MSKGRYDVMPAPEAAALGHALLAKMRGKELDPTQRATLAQVRSEDAAMMPVIDEDETLASFARGDDAEVRVSWRRFRGSSPFLDVRRFERSQGQLRATKQGVTIRARELGQLMAVLVTAMQRIDVEGEAAVAEARPRCR